MPTKKVDFRTAAGHLLSARLELPDGPVRAYALYAHCYTCGKDVIAARRISATLASHGIGVLRFDFTGLGASEGDFADTNFSSNVQELVAAAGHLRQVYAAPRLLIGHSLGGTAALAAAGLIPEVKAVATIASPSEPRFLMEMLGERAGTIAEQGEAQVMLAGREFTLRSQLLDDLTQHGLEDKIRHLNRALLVMHSPIDSAVDVSHAMRIFQLARHPKSFVSLDHMDHLLTNRNDGAYVAGVIAAWSMRYLQSE
ncbi:alpha/beta hydrolase family protein [Massilia horti]|uniref:Alpha/beta hydrolase n=1 Tax=Massilia horti TaxID=2562153 RepID=A0A4Y9T5P4_9BURK|nr:alpha/beta hydrolase [Massilia horti]TFW36176.1 alpha/beta hydrolase [Massilia horti]